MPSRSLKIFLALLILAAGGCFDSRPGGIAGGGGVETTEGNLASLGTSPAGARVSLIPADFDPLRDSLPDSLTVLADANGAYRFRGLAPGRYNLEAHLPSVGTRCFRPGVEIAEGGRNILATDTLAAPGRLRLGWDGFRRGILTQIGRRFRLDLTGLEPDSGGITLDSLPAGVLPPFTFTVPSDSTSHTWTDSVRIAPGGSDSIPIREELEHAAALTLETTFSVFDSLEGYPLLVRLTSPDFPFGEAAPGGADLRFTTEDGIALPHVVEGWDSAAGHAEIWVRLKAQPDAGRASLRMYWGNPSAAYRAGPVFGFVSGYTSVWHLDERTSGGPGLLEDAGPFALRMSAVGLVPELQGVIGSAQRFDGASAYAYATDVSQVRATAQWTVSAWIAPDTGASSGIPAGTPARRWTILSNWNESDSTGFILEYLPDSRYVGVTLGFGGKVTRMLPILREDPGVAWHQVGATYDGSEVAVYLDGAQVSTAPAGPGDLPLPSGEYVIGARGSADPRGARVDFFRGGIDEVRMTLSLPRRAWLHFDFPTQGPGSNPLRLQRLR